MPFSTPSTNKTEKKNLGGSYVYAEESFDTIFNVGYWGTTPPIPHGLWVGKIAHGWEG